jgi:hypothetical protein
MTKAECEEAAVAARELMLYELTHPGKRSYSQMADAVHDKLLEMLSSMLKSSPDYASPGPTYYQQTRKEGR